jgi:phage-related protein
MGFALNQVQQGDEPIATKALKGFGGRTVLELIDDFDGDTYRAAYTVRFAGVVYVLHASRRKQKGALLHRSRMSISLSRACGMPNCITAHVPTEKDISYDET